MSKTLNKISEIKVSYKPKIMNNPLIKSSDDVFKYLVPFYNNDTLALQEKFLVMYLNRQHKILGVFPLSIGGITSTVVDIRLLISVALKVAATSIIISHNHPSGNNYPSDADKEITKKIKDACKLFDITVLDHMIIVSDKKYLSFTDEGLM